jgi:hypothetical protein
VIAVRRAVTERGSDDEVAAGAPPSATAPEPPTPQPPAPDASVAGAPRGGRPRTGALWLSTAALVAAVAILGAVLASTRHDLDVATRRAARAEALASGTTEELRLRTSAFDAVRRDVLAIASRAQQVVVPPAPDTSALVADLTALLDCVNRNFAIVASGGGTLVRCASASR